MNKCCCACHASGVKMITGISGDVKNVCDITFEFEDGTSKLISMEEGKKYTVTYLNNNGMVETSTGVLLAILYQEGASSEYRSDVSTCNNGSMQSSPIHRKVFAPPPPLPGVGALPPDHRHCWIGFPQPVCDPNSKFHGAVYYQGSCQPGTAWASPYAREKESTADNLINPMHVHQEYPIVTTTGATIGFAFDCSDSYTSVTKTIMLSVIRDLKVFDIITDSKDNQSGQFFMQTTTSEKSVLAPTFFMIPNVIANSWNLRKNDADVFETDCQLAAPLTIDTIEDFNDIDYAFVSKDENGNITFVHNLYIMSKEYTVDASGLLVCTIKGVLYFEDDSDAIMLETADNLGLYTVTNLIADITAKIHIDLADAEIRNEVKYYSIHDKDDPDSIFIADTDHEEGIYEIDYDVASHKLTFDEQYCLVKFYDENKDLKYKAKLNRVNKVSYRMNTNKVLESTFITIGLLVELTD